LQGPDILHPRFVTDKDAADNARTGVIDYFEYKQTNLLRFLFFLNQICVRVSIERDENQLVKGPLKNVSQQDEKNCEKTNRAVKNLLL